MTTPSVSPHVDIVARPNFGFEAQNFLNHFLPEGEATWRVDPTATAAERLVEFAGRICYMSFGSRQSHRTTSEYISNLVRHGHESVLEHAVWTFVVSGVSRAFSHQLVRHRVGFAFSQLSQQYHDDSDVRYLRPPQIDGHPSAMAAWNKATTAIQGAYRDIVSALTDNAGGPEVDTREAIRALRSAARSILPNASETVIAVTANARSLRHFFRIRGSVPGDLEMRRVAALILERIRPDGPALFADFETKTLSDGFPIVVHSALP